MIGKMDGMNRIDLWRMGIRYFPHRIDGGALRCVGFRDT